MTTEIKIKSNPAYGKKERRPIDMLGANKYESMEDYPEFSVKAGDRIGAYTFDDVIFLIHDDDGAFVQKYDYTD